MYLDNKLVATVNTGGCKEATNRLFEALDIPPAVHTIRIVCKSGSICLDWIAYESAVPEPTYEKISPLSDLITYNGNWAVEESTLFHFGKAMATNDPGASAEIEFEGTAIRWIGKRVLNRYGVGLVYLDGEYVDTVYNYGEDETGKILFERTGLNPGKHTLKITQSTNAIDIEYLAVGNISE